MGTISYVSGTFLRELDELKEKLDSCRDRHALTLHNQRRSALEQEALNTSLYIEYPEFQHANRGSMDRQSRKLLQRLNTAWQYCGSNIGPKEAITIRDLEVIQGIIIPEGQLGIRTGNVTFSHPHEVPPPHYPLVREMLSQVLFEVDRLKGSMHPVELAAYLHLHLLYIHPFMDGNGRTTRIAQNFMLFRDGYVPAVIKPAERWFYFSLLDAANGGIIREQTGPQKPFFEYVAHKVRDGLEMVLAR